MPCTCECPKRVARSMGAPEVYLIAARRNYQLGLVIPEHQSSGVIEIQSAADYSLYLPAGWPVANVRDCQFVPCGCTRLGLKPRRVVVNLVTAGEVGELTQPLRHGSCGSAAGDEGSGPKEARGSTPGKERGLSSGRTSQQEPSSDILGRKEISSAARARTADGEPRPPRPRPVSPDLDRAPAPAATNPKTC